MKILYTILLLWFTISSCTWAQPIDIETAKEIARKALKTYATRSRQQPISLNLKHQTEVSYLFVNDEGHFALVAANEKLPALMAYGTSAQGQLPPPVATFLNTLQQSFSNTIHTSSTTTPVEPLLPFVRHQKSPYNAYCPYYTYEDGSVSQERCVVGCVATALEEVISYYRRTVTLLDTLKGWTTPHYTLPDIAPGTRVDCQLIANNYDTDAYTPEQADAVARLSLYCGMAARMNWGLSESGARVSRLASPLKKIFGYGYVHYVDSYQYTPDDWLQMLRQEIESGRPILYAGYTTGMSGHAFVLDGQDSEGFFHVNWGYGGNYDGYYRIDLLNFAEPKYDLTPEGFADGFFCNQEALFMHPDEIKVTLPDTLPRNGQEIAIDSVQLLLPPETGKFTPMRLHLRNTTEKPLTTPLEIFTNLATDTAFFEQGDYIAITGCQLNPGERTSLDIYTRFDQGGERLLRVSADDIHILYEKNIQINTGKPCQLTFSEPSVNYPQPDCIQVLVEVSNQPHAGRSGQNIIFELYEGEPKDGIEGTRHYQRLYLEPGSSTMVSGSFQGLTPGNIYTLLVRSPWKIVGQATFQLPPANPIEKLPVEKNDLPVRWYNTSGQPTSSPTLPGTYIRQQGKRTTKHFIK